MPQEQDGLRFLHRNDAGSSKTVATQMALEPDMGIEFRLHDNESCISLRMFWWHQQIDVAKYATARLIQHKSPERLVLFYPVSLRPQAFTGRRRDSPNDDIAHFTLGMRRNHVDGLQTAHDKLLGEHM